MGPAWQCVDCGSRRSAAACPISSPCSGAGLKLPGAPQSALHCSLLTYLRIMLQRLSTLSGGLRAVGGPWAALPALARHVRMYGFGSHVSDNGEAWQGSAARCPNPARLQARP